jgi:PAS domain S-box-containing protein
MNLPAIAADLLPTIWAKMPQFLWLARPDGCVDYINDFGLQYLGVKPEEIVGWSWMQVLHPADREPTMHAWLEAVAQKVPIEVRYRMLTAGGAFRWNIVRAHPVHDAAGNVLAYVGTCTDVDDWKQSLRDLSSANREIEGLRALLDCYETHTDIGIGVVDPDLRFLRINSRLAAINGLGRHEHLGRSIVELLPRLASSLEPILRQVVATSKPVLDVQLCGETPAAHGQVRAWIGNYFPVVLANEMMGVVMIIREVHDGEQKSLRSEPEVQGRAANSSSHAA